MKKVVITVVGLDKVGIIAGVSKILAENNVNVLSINQTILDGFFNMVLMGDMENSVATITDLQDLLAIESERLGMDIRAQHADVFYRMHRV